MNTEFIKASHHVFTYELKEGTKSSFYLKEGSPKLLPCRISFMPYSGKEGKRKAHYEINGTYKQNEIGKYYSMNNRRVHTKIIPINAFPSFVGWGEVDERFKIYDLLIIHSTNNCKESFHIHVFIGMAKGEYLESVCNYLLTYINNKSPKAGLLFG
jgi:hypothetical protein